MLTYFISYAHSNAATFGHGNLAMQPPRPIQSMDDVNAITAWLRDTHRIDNPVVLSFCPLGEQEAQR